MAVIIGSARIDEHGHAVGGSAGDQTGKEVSTQTFYNHKKGWYILRPKSADIASKMAQAMKRACDNANIGYDQSNRLGVLKYGTGSKIKTECDCSSLVRLCIKEASGKDVGNFSTENEASVLEKSGLFEPRKKYISGMTLYTGDVLVTCTKGHTVIVVYGASRGGSSNKIAVDGSWGKETTKAAQKVFKTVIDGIVSNQPFKNRIHLPACHLDSWEFWETRNRYQSGSDLIRAMQQWLKKKGKYKGAEDGWCGEDTIKGLQKFLKVSEKKKIGTSERYVIGEKTVQAFQKWLNEKL